MLLVSLRYFVGFNYVVEKEHKVCHTAGYPGQMWNDDRPSSKIEGGPQR